MKLTKNRFLSSSLVSPFDAIRHFDQYGNEYWTGRELMEFMGYSKWQRFQTPIQRTITALTTLGDCVENHIIAFKHHVKRSQGGGRSLSDYKLSRYATYMIAMNGDSRKPEVAMAQHYFVEQTREAELRKEAEENQKLKISDAEALKLAVDCLIQGGVAASKIEKFKAEQMEIINSRRV